MKKKPVLLAALTLAVTVLAACGNNTQSSETPSASNQATSTQSSQKTDTFTYAIGGDPNSTNPINTSDRWGLTYANAIFSPLVRVHGDGSKENELAEEVSVSEDGLTVTVKLRQDIKWSDGEALTADDVVFTYNRKADKENGGANNLWIGDAPIVAEKVDEYTVAFQLPAVSSAAVNNLATETFIIPEHVYKDITDFSVKELSVAPVGTGPYKLKEYRRGEYIQFEANENYYKGTPNIKNLVFRIIPSADTAKLTLQKGEVDAAWLLPGDIAEVDASKFNVYTYSENRIAYLGLNTLTPELSDVRVRQALFYALDKHEMNLAVYLNDEYYVTPYSILPPANAFVSDKVEKYERNLEKARALLQEAGVSNLKVNLGFNSSNAENSLQATLIQQQLSEIGVTVELAGGDNNAVFTELRKKGSTTYNMLLGGYIMGSDPDQYRPLFTTQGYANYFQYDGSETTDKLFQAGVSELDETKRREIYDQLQLELSQAAIIYPIVDNKKVLVVNNRITDVEEAGLVPIYTLEDFSKLKEQ